MSETPKSAEIKKEASQPNGVELSHIQEARQLKIAGQRVKEVSARQVHDRENTNEKRSTEEDFEEILNGFDMWPGTPSLDIKKPQENFVESLDVKDQKEFVTAQEGYQKQLRKTYESHVQDLEGKPEEQKKLWPRYLEGCIQDLKINPENIWEDDIQLLAKSLPDVWKNTLLNPDLIDEQNPALQKIKDTVLDRIADGAASIDRDDFPNDESYQKELLKNFKDISGVSVENPEDLQALLGTLKKQKEEGKSTSQTEKMMWALQNTLGEGGGGNGWGFDSIGGPVSDIWVCSENFPTTPEGLQSALSSIWGDEGVSESKDPQRVREYHAAAGLEAGPSTPWCMSFVQYMSRKYLGYNGPKTASARDGLKMGNKIDTPEVGAIVVTRGSGPSGCHIGISVGNGEYISWNSGNAVKTKKIPTGSQFRSLQKGLA